MAAQNHPQNVPYDLALSGIFLDTFGNLVAPENVVICDNFDIFDLKQIKFTPFGDMLYRGRLFSRKEALPILPQQLQAIYYTYYPPNQQQQQLQQQQQPQQADFTTFRINHESSSSSSEESMRLLLQPSVSSGSGPPIADSTDAAGLLGIPLTIDGKIPHSQAYKQYEPRGFKMISDNPISNPFKGWSKFSAVAGQLSRKRKQMGFSREDVVLYGGLHCTPCRQPNISDPMLTTIFKQENFYNTTQEVYDIITPALRLAEKLITDPALIGYWTTLAFGTRIIDTKLTEQTGICHERLQQDVAFTDESYIQTLNLLNCMGNKVEYRFGGADDADFKNQKCYGWTKRLSRKWNIAPAYHALLQPGAIWATGVKFPVVRQFAKDPWDDFQVVHLHSDFLTAARRFNATKNQDLAARLRFNFFFAVNIVHELTHVFEGKSSQTHFETMASRCTSLEDFRKILDPRTLLGTYEAYWGTSPWAEAGGRWEWQTFGGRVHPINGRSDASLGVVIYSADGFGAPFIDPLKYDNNTGFCVKMGFIEEIQQQSFWTRPHHSVNIPKTGAVAYNQPNMVTADVEHYLRERAEEYANAGAPITDPAEIKMAHLITAAIAQEDPDAGSERPEKRQRLDDSSGATKPREIKRPAKRGGLRQTIIQRFPSKADADAEATRKEAMAQMAQKLQREKEADVAFHDVPSGQQRLDDLLAYSGEDSQDAGLATGFAEEPYIDPATKRREDLTLEDKWKIAEEWICLPLSWEPIEFQAQRADHPDWRPTIPFNPDDPVNSFTENSILWLLELRTKHPGKSWPERHAAEKALYGQKKDVASRLAQMDELVTYLGYSRIESERHHQATGEFPMGMKVSNFPQYKPILDAFRLTQKIQSTGEYVSAVNRGQVAVGASGVGLIKEDSKLTVEATAAQTAKITDYFAKFRSEESSHASSASTAALSADPVGFAPLTKLPTPHELIRQYEAWVAAGADMGNKPEGIYPTQLLSAALGGSLQTISPQDLAKVVEARQKMLEVEKAEQRAREVKARADAAEERRKLERGSGSGSGSGSEKTVE